MDIASSVARYEWKRTAQVSLESPGAQKSSAQGALKGFFSVLGCGISPGVVAAAPKYPGGVGGWGQASLEFHGIIS